MKEPKRKPVKNRKPHEKHECSKRSLGKAANPRSKRKEAKREKKKSRRKRHTSWHTDDGKIENGAKGIGKSRRKAEKGEAQRKKKGEPNTNDSTTADEEAKTDQPRSEYGVWNASRIRLSRKKEDEPEANTKRREKQGESNRGRAVRK